MFLFHTGSPPEHLPGALSGEIITLSGVVDRIEMRQDGQGRNQTILFLHTAAFCGGNPQTETDNPETNNIETGHSEMGNPGTEKVGRGAGVLCALQAGEPVPFLGERITVRGRAEGFAGRRNPGGFDAASYYRGQGLAFAMQEARLQARGETYDEPRQALFVWKRYLAGRLDLICGEDGGIMRAMLLGDKVALQKETKALYQDGGISHILAISGLHISFLGAGLYRCLKRLRLPRKVAAVLAGAALLFYVDMTGRSPSACRAGLMFVIALLAETAGRSYERMTALSVSALLLVCQNPYLPGQSGFLLSFGAILGLELVCPILSELWPGRVSGLFVAGLSVTAVTLPVLLHSFYEFPVYSLALNLFVIPLMGVVMALGLLALFFGMFSLPLGRALFFPVHVIFVLFREGCVLTERLPGGRWLTGAPTWPQLALYCALLIFFCLLRRYMTRGLALLLLVGAAWTVRSPFSVGDVVTVLDVGQGDGIVVRSGQGRVALIDGGSSSERKLSEYTLLPYLKSQGIERLDYVFLTHMDADHTNGTVDLLRRGEEEHVEIGALVLPALARPDQDYVDAVALARERGIRVLAMDRGDELEMGGLRFLCLHPRAEESYAGRNQASLVLYVKSGAFSALFTGDLDGEAERDFAAAYPAALERVTLLKAGHHGSAASCGEAFLEKVGPALTAISCGANNRYGHPAPETVDRLLASGSRVWVTKETGAICVRVWGGRVWVKTLIGT